MMPSVKCNLVGLLWSQISSIKHRPNQGGDIFFGQRFHGESFNAERPGIFFRHKAAVAGTEDDWQIRLDLQHTPGQIAASHARHCLVSDHQVEVLRLILESGESLDTVFPGGNLVTESLEHILAHFSQYCLIVNEENMFAASLNIALRLLIEQGTIVNDWQVHLKNCALPGLALA